jgi:hypothetical protein
MFCTHLHILERLSTSLVQKMKMIPLSQIIENRLTRKLTKPIGMEPDQIERLGATELTLST